MDQPALQKMLARLVTNEMEKLDMKPSQLSRRLNYGPHTINRVLKGVNTGSLHLWQDILDELELDFVIQLKPRQLSFDELEERRQIRLRRRRYER